MWGGSDVAQDVADDAGGGVCAGGDLEEDFDFALFRGEAAGDERALYQRRRSVSPIFVLPMGSPTSGQ